MKPLQPLGIHAVDLNRHPGPEDWLVLAVGNDRLVPVRTYGSVTRERLAVVVHTDPPPSQDALAVLAQLVAEGGILHPGADDRVEAPGVQWATEALARIQAAVGATSGHRTRLPNAASAG
jgi:hypothetical protein